MPINAISEPLNSCFYFAKTTTGNLGSRIVKVLTSPSAITIGKIALGVFAVYSVYRLSNFILLAWARAIKMEKMETIFGQDTANLYSLLMTANPDQKKINEMNPKLEFILKLIKTTPFEKSELPSDFDMFQKVLEKKTCAYFSTLADEIEVSLKTVFAEKNLDQIKLEVELFHLAKKDKLELTIEELDRKSFLTEKIEDFKIEIEALRKDFSDQEVFKIYYHKLPDSATLNHRWSSLDGLYGKEALSSIIEDLSCFFEINKKTEMDQFITDLQIALESHSMERDAVKKIHQKLKNYSEQKEITSEFIVINGGFYGHGILYQIKKNNSETFDLSLINTGNGAIVINESKEGKISSKSQDVVYTGLKIEELSESLFQELIRKKDSAKNMNEIYEFLDQSLLKQSAKKIGGHKRSRQNRGTCALKPILELLKTELGKDLYRDFNLFMIERALNSVEEAAKTITPTVLKLLFPTPPDEIATPEYYSDQLAKLIDTGRVVLENKRLKYKREVF